MVNIRRGTQSPATAGLASLLLAWVLGARSSKAGPQNVHHSPAEDPPLHLTSIQIVSKPSKISNKHITYC